MIEQFALHKNTDPVTKEVKERIFNYPGIQIRNEGNTAKYVVLFSHEKKLTREDFGLDETWGVYENHKYTISNN
jgi:hypothetical protein